MTKHSTDKDFLVNDRSEREKELEKALQEMTLQNEIISAISKLYIQIYTIDLRQGTYHEVADNGINISEERYHGTLQQMTEIGANMLAAPEYRNVTRDFLNFDTLADRLRGNRSISEEIKGFDGRWYTIIFIAKKWDDAGEVTHALYAIQDVSKQKERELEYQKQLVKKAEEADRANQAKTIFLRHMSHDIRTPLNGISGLIDLAENYAEDTERLRENRRRVKASIEYLNSLVDNVLDLSKLETENGVTLDCKPFDLVSLLTQQIIVIKTQAEELGLTFKGGKDLSKIHHRHLIGSAHHLNRILMNLAGNALKYNKQGGSICTYCQEISSDDHTAMFQFVCEDTGIGISKEFLDHIYEPFTQEGKETFNSFTGSGLGLSFVKNIVTLLNGTIECESTENVGTKFIVTIPFEIDHAPELTRSEMQNKLNLHGKHALLVDDNDLNLEIAKTLLELEGLEIETAVNGLEAYERFVESEPNHYDFIFMDIMMPIMNGLDATKKIRASVHPDAATIPIIAMTANAFQDDIESSLAAGMNAHLTKPLDLDKIRKTLQELLRK